MSVPDEVIRQKVVQWLAYGGEDLRLARHGLTMPGGCSYRLIAYHAQQCAEKHLKAYLVRGYPLDASDPYRLGVNCYDHPKMLYQLASSGYPPSGIPSD